MTLRVVTIRQEFLNKHAPTILAGCIASKDNWWRMGEVGHKELAKAIALCDEIHRALDEEDEEIRTESRPKGF